MLKKEKRKRKKANLQRARERPKAPNLVSFPKVAHKTKKKKKFLSQMLFHGREKNGQNATIFSQERERAINCTSSSADNHQFESPWSSDKSVTEH